MKKIFTLLLLFGLMISTQCAFSYQIKADAATKRLPQGTKMHLIMAEPLTTSEIQAGDMFSARLSNDIRLNGRTILPSGSLIRGTVEKYRTSALPSRSALLYLTFDHVVTPQGRQIPLRAGVCSSFDLTAEGAISGGGNYFNELGRNVSKTGYIISKTTKWGIKSGDDLFPGGRFLITPIAAVGGTLGGAVYLVGDSVIDLFRKGNDVIIDQGKSFDIILLEPLDVPII